MFRHLPHQRKLSLGEQEKAKELLAIKANKKMIKDKLEKQTGKVVTLKDLSNIMTQSKFESNRNNLELAVKQLCEKHGKLYRFHISNYYSNGINK